MINVTKVIALSLTIGVLLYSSSPKYEEKEDAGVVYIDSNGKDWEFENWELFVEHILKEKTISSQPSFQ